MTREQFQKASRTVSLYGNLLICLVGGCLSILGYLAALWAEPVVQNLGRFIRSHVQDEGTVGLVSGVVFSVVLAPFVVIIIFPLLWVDRRFGLRCSGCGRSVTARCHTSEVLRTGKCCHCQKVLFE